jgi:DNA repair protein RadC
MSGRARSRQISLLRPDPEALLHLARENLALLTEISAHYELARLGPPAQPQSMCRPEDVAGYLGPELADLAQEQFRVLLLDVKNHLLGTALVYQGGTSSISIRLAECFREAVRVNATSVIFCHNHPSGDPTPSPEDVAVTRLAIQAGDLLGIAVLDHIIVGKGAHVSLRQRGLLPASKADGA